MSDHYHEQRERHILSMKDAIQQACPKSDAVSAMLIASGSLLEAKEAMHKIPGISYYTRCVADMIGTMGRTIGDWVDEVEESYSD
jgi:hypothetical protein